jgi:predicted Zn-dependent protease
MMSPRSRPYSLYAAEDRFLSQDACRDLLKRVIQLSTGGGEVQLSVRSRWTGNLRWARNESTTSGDTTYHNINITRFIRGASASASTNQIDDEALRSCIRRAEFRINYRNPDPDWAGLRKAEKYVETNLWSDATFGIDADTRAGIQQRLVEPAVAAELQSFGYLEIMAIGNGVMNSAGLFAYQPQTRAEFSVTVRSPKGNGSGWAGVENNDWRKIDAAKVTARAVEKCKASVNPVAIEPGRYTVILEPQAVGDLMVPLVQSLVRPPAEAGQGPWANRPDVSDEQTSSLPEADPGASPRASAGFEGGSKIGLRVLDQRITISADPADPEAPFVPFAYDTLPYRAVTWIEKGVLKELAYPRFYALPTLNRSDPLNNSGSFRMAGGSTSIDEMIAGTSRGILVTRLTNVHQILPDSLLCGGTTSDGLWLIEGGKVTRSLKNFRFRESPLFAFNNLQAIGPPERILLDMPAICPPAKIRDFSLTSLADAI